MKIPNHKMFIISQIIIHSVQTLLVVIKAVSVESWMLYFTFVLVENLQLP